MEHSGEREDSEVCARPWCQRDLSGLPRHTIIACSTEHGRPVSRQVVALFCVGCCGCDRPRKRRGQPRAQVPVCRVCGTTPQERRDVVHLEHRERYGRPSSTRDGEPIWLLRYGPCYVYCHACAWLAHKPRCVLRQLVAAHGYDWDSEEHS